MITHKVRIVRVTYDMAYVDDRLMDENKLVAFPFGKIEGYKGETAKELGLRPGLEVTLKYDKQKVINSVSIR